MEAKAVSRHIRISPRKTRLVIDLIRGKKVGEALALLRFMPKRAAYHVAKVVQSAAANAEHNYNLNKDALFITKAYVDGGATAKRFHPRQRGQAFPILKRSSHITVVVAEQEGK